MLLYFSGTGNSMSVAKDLATKLNEEYMHINDALKKQDEILDSRIGIVFPVYFADLPTPVLEFFKNYKFNSEQYLYIILTCGKNPGNGIATVGKILRKRGIKLSYARHIVMPNNMSILTGGSRPSTEGLLERQEEFIKSVVLDVNNQVVNTKKFVKKPIFTIENKLTYNKLTINVLKKEVDHSRCVGCGVCQRVCPVKNVKVVNGKSHIGNNCIECLACIQWCPNGSITAIKKHVDGRQYHHPKIILDDMFRRKYEEESKNFKE